MPSGYRALSFWHDSLPDEIRPRPPLRGDTRADVAIIGAGYTGLWTAWYLKQIEPGLDVAVVEAETAGFGASGRNGGWCSGFLSGIDHWFDDPGRREGALRLQRQMFDAVREVGAVARDAGIDCHFEQSGAVEVAVNPAQLRRLEQELEYARGLGFGEQDYAWLDGPALQNVVAADGALAAIHVPHCAAIHPARLARGLAERLEERGVTVYEDSRVRSFGPGGVRTAEGSIEAGTVVLATEGYSGSMAGHERRLIPVHSMMVATEPLDPARLDRLGLARRYCFGNLDRLVTYGQRTADDRIAFGCRGHYDFASGVRSRFDPNDAAFEVVRRTLLRLFPALAGVGFTHAWGGALGVSRSLRPAVVFDAATRVGWAGGYFGNGVAAANLAGRTLADLVAGRDSERIHTPWVNPPEAARRWEPEPLRWLGFRGTRALMALADRAEYRTPNPLLPRLVDRLLP